MVNWPHHKAPARMKPQTAAVLDILTNTRSLTPLIAATAYGIGSLTSRISELVRLGYRIEKEIRFDAYGRRYVEYSLVGTPTETCASDDWKDQCPGCGCWKATAEACS